MNRDGRHHQSEACKHILTYSRLERMNLWRLWRFSREGGGVSFCVRDTPSLEGERENQSVTIEADTRPGLSSVRESDQTEEQWKESNDGGSSPAASVCYFCPANRVTQAGRGAVCWRDISLPQGANTQVVDLPPLIQYLSLGGSRQRSSESIKSPSLWAGPPSVWARVKNSIQQAKRGKMSVFQVHGKTE